MRSFGKFLLLLLTLTFAIAAIAFARYQLAGTPVVTGSDTYVAWGTVRRPTDIVLAHQGREPFIRVNGRTYPDVKGLPPFYLRLPELNSILFVTVAGRDAIEFHIVDVRSWADAKIRGEKLSFGGHIGDPDPPGSPYTDFVEGEASNRIVVATQYPRARTRIFLDLSARRVEKVEYEEFDKNGQLGQRHVYMDGKPVQ